MINTVRVARTLYQSWTVLKCSAHVHTQEHVQLSKLHLAHALNVYCSRTHFNTRKYSRHTLNVELKYALSSYGLSSRMW